MSPPIAVAYNHGAPYLIALAGKDEQDHDQITVVAMVALAVFVGAILWLRPGRRQETVVGAEVGLGAPTGDSTLDTNPDEMALLDLEAALITVSDVWTPGNRGQAWDNAPDPAAEAFKELELALLAVALRDLEEALLEAADFALGEGTARIDPATVAHFLKRIRISAPASAAEQVNELAAMLASESHSLPRVMPFDRGRALLLIGAIRSAT
jgi:hypothetical protein